eukprot:scaffold229322_cov30-Tisochrysis_lutea.AAC.1
MHPSNGVAVLLRRWSRTGRCTGPVLVSASMNHRQGPRQGSVDISVAHVDISSPRCSRRWRRWVRSIHRAS